ncbi:MAG: T9SS type A sorting domain-containing protein, partial [Chitinophagaceae bacterium]
MKTPHTSVGKPRIARTFKCIIAAIAFLLVSTIGFSQSESHDFITYDTTLNQSGMTWTMRISRPRNMFVAGHPDAQPRPLILTMPGQGEVGTNTSYLTRYGPHYWMNNGWDGSVVLGNGTHYPIIITVISSIVNPRPPAVLPMLQFILNTYKIKRNSVHLGGLSMGGFTWGKLMIYAASPGDETAMSLITSLTALQGISNETFAPYNSWAMPGWSAFGQWAKKYKGKFFGLEGTADTRKVWAPRDAMEATTPGSAYFAFETYGGGSHCCWNSMYDPNMKDWGNTGTITNPNITTNKFYPNSAGTYKKGSSIFQWMLRQGDTTLVGGSQTPNIAPVANAGADKVVTLPVSTTVLNGSATDADGTIASYSWTKTAGPTSFLFSNANIAAPTVNNLVSGSYTFRLTVTDNRGGTASDEVKVTVNNAVVVPPPTSPVNPPPSGSGRYIKVNLYNGSNAYNNAEWNNWTVATAGATNITSSSLKYSDGGSSTVKAILSQTTGTADNAANYGGGVAPAEVLRHTSYSTMGRTLKFTGLTAGKQYNVEFFASRAGATVNRTVFIIGNLKDTVLTSNNKNESAIFNSITASSSGEINISISRLNTYTYLNGFIITEVGSGSTSRIAAADSTASTAKFDVFPNPVTDRFVLQMNNTYAGAVNVRILDLNGTVKKQFAISKDKAGTSQVYLSIGDLPAGEYTVQLVMGQTTETKTISKL